LAWQSWGTTTHILCLVCGGLGFGVWGLAPEDLGFRVCGRTSFVYEAEAEAEAEAEPPRSPSGLGFRAKPCSDRRRRRFFCCMGLRKD
jgi:hypothetical protein